jgi:signal transduction histidine kinase
MSQRSGMGDAPRGIGAWWQRLWSEPDAESSQGSSQTTAQPSQLAFVAQDATPKQTEPAPEVGRISREALMRLQPAGPAQEEAPDLLQQRANFWATATHDLCQPAQALALFLERLQRLPPQTSAQALHGYLQSSMEDLTRLLAGLMELAQIDAGEVQASSMAVSVDELFARVREQLADQAQAKGLRLVARSKGQTVLADAALLERILLALGRNAVRFCVQGTVLLSARAVQGGAGVRLDVSDSGPGIAERDHRKIFTPFAQRNLTSSHGPTRPSLGLHIASRHAQLMGTGLQLRSALGRGSRFSITLPLAAVNVQAQGADLSDALQAIGLDGYRVALFDTDPERAAIVAAWLRGWACVLLDEQDMEGAKALHPQAIVCAWQADAPQEAVRRILAWRARIGVQIPACIIYADQGATDALRDLPTATAVLSQPLQAAQLRAWLRRVLRS